MSDRPLGVHVSIAGGLDEGVRRAAALGCTSMQMFSHNPRGWALRPITQEEAERFKAARAQAGIVPVYIHCSYLLNVASPDDALRQRSVRMLEAEMRRADELGVEYVVLHTGTAYDGAARERVMRSLSEALYDKGFRGGLLLENTSGKRGDIASALADLGQLQTYAASLVKGVCIDTCHAYAAGYDLGSEAGARAFAEEVEVVFMPGSVRLLHLNDSKGALGSGTDRHEHLGKGRIGLAGLRAVLGADVFRGVPVILETPKDDEGSDAANLAVAISLTGQGGRGRSGT